MYHKTREKPALLRLYLIGIVFVTASPLVAALPPATPHARTRNLSYDAGRREWVETPPPAPGTTEGDLHAVRVLIRDAEYQEALAAVKKFVTNYSVSDPLYPKITIAKAEALIGQGEYEKAYLVLQGVLGEFHASALTPEVLRLQFVIAEAYLGGVKRKVWGMRLFSGEDTAFSILDEISAGHPGTRLAELAIKTKADYLFRKGEHVLAELEYSRLLTEYPQSAYSQFSLRRSAEAALAGFAGVEYDETSLIEAQERYFDYQRSYPAAANQEQIGLILDTIRERRADKELVIGEYYERTEHVPSAIHHYQSVRRSWPETIAATKATSRLVLLGVLESVSPPTLVPETTTSNEASNR